MSKVHHSPGLWSTQEVLSWASRICLPEDVTKALAENEIDGAVLITLKKAELKSELGISKLATRRFFWDSLEILRNTHQVADFYAAIELHGKEIQSLERDSINSGSDDISGNIFQILRDDVEEQRRVISDSTMALQLERTTIDPQFYQDMQFATVCQEENDRLSIQEGYDHSYAQLLDEKREKGLSQYHQARSQSVSVANAAKSLFSICMDTCSKNKINVAEALETGKVKVIQYRNDSFDDENSMSTISNDIESSTFKKKMQAFVETKKRGMPNSRTQMTLSTNARQIPKIKRCDVCFDMNTFGFQLACNHSNCVECMTQYLKTATADITLLPLRCCEIPIDTGVINMCLPAEESQKLQMRIMEREATNKMYCPKCNSFINLDYIDSTESSNFNCFSCNMLLCSTFGTLSHSGMSCKEHKDKRKGEDDATFLSTAKGLGYKQCPRCSVAIEFTHGCNHMTCILCKHEFCFQCMKSWEKRTNKCSSGVCERWEEHLLVRDAEARLEAQEVARGVVYRPERRQELIQRAQQALNANESCVHNFVRTRRVKGRRCESCDVLLNFFGMVCQNDCESVVCNFCANHHLPRVGWI